MFTLPPQLALLAKYGNHTVNDITEEVVLDVAKALGVTAAVTPALLADVSTILRDADVDKLADLLGKPQIFPRLMEVLVNSQTETSDIVRRCRHCNQFNLYTLE